MMSAFAIQRPASAVVLALAFMVALLALDLRPVHAAELVMFERAGCSYCAAFDREVAPAYPLSDEGKTIPLRRVDVTQPVPSDLAFIRVERLAPVFVLVEGGREIGRIRGYAGEDHFWGMFGVLVDRLRKQGAASTPVPLARLSAQLER